MKKSKIIIIANFIGFYAILLFSGCTAKLTDPDLSFEPPKYVEEMPAKEVNNNYSAPGSIFGQGDNPLFCDHKAMKVNDIVTIIINETAKSKTTGAKHLSKSGTTSLGGANFTSGGTNGAMVANINTLNGIVNTGVSISSSNQFKGQGSATKDASFTTTVSARVVKVLQNGNIFVMGKREILIDDQIQIIPISGVIRPYDIDADNMVISENIANLKIEYEQKGELKDGIEKPWGSKILDNIWPF